MRLEKYDFFILRSFSGDVRKVIKKFVGRHNIINTLLLTSLSRKKKRRKLEKC